MQKIRVEFPIANQTVKLDLDPSQYSQENMLQWLAGGGLYEAEVVRVLEQTLKPGDTFIDVGAHVGYFSMIGAALVGPTGCVLAMEPHHPNHDALIANMDLNNLHHVECLSNAAGRSSRTRQFWINQDNDGGHAFWDVGLHNFNKRSREAPKTRMAVVTALDDLKFLKGPVHVIKIDTEGCEHEVLIGATKILTNNPGIVVIAEINDFGLAQMMSSRNLLRGLMETMGFRTFALPASSEPIELKPSEWPDDSNNCVFNVMFKR